MIRFLIDEDMPRSTAKLLRQAGFECLDVRDIELRGKKDDATINGLRKKTASSFLEIWVLQITSAILWAAIRALLPPDSPNEMPTDKLNQILFKTIKNIHEDIPGNPTIIEPEKVKIRRR